MLVRRITRAATLLLAVPLIWGIGCTQDVFLNQTASFGGDTAGSSGGLDIAFINNTPFRAIFTFGTYNNTDQFSQPELRQFVGNNAGALLEGDSVTAIGTLPCNRVFSIGDPELLRLIEENVDTDAIVLDEEALVRGVAFSSAELGDENAGLATEGFAPELRALLGVDFPCGAIVIIRFEIDDLGEAPFRIDFEVIPPREDDRGV